MAGRPARAQRPPATGGSACFNAGMGQHDFGAWLLGLDWAIRLGALWWIPRRSKPAAARGWLLLVGFVPLLGLPIYLVWGQPWVSRRRRMRQARASQQIRHRQLPLTAWRWSPHPGSTAGEVAALIERLGDFMPMPGNRVQLHDDYDAALRVLLDDIRHAQRDVHLLYYLMFDDAVGRTFCEALLEARRRGVRVHVLLDAVGAKPGLRAFAARLREGGVAVQAALAGGLAWRRGARMDLRNHRKLAVVDGRIGWTGSQNLACAGFVRGHPNREVTARCEGPIVAQLDAVFASDWFIETGDTLDVASPLPPAHQDGAAQLLPSGPAYPFENARLLVLALIERARHELVLATPYFVPDDATLAALQVAALSGVRVRLLLSASNNQPLTAWAQQAYYADLLAAGVEIHLHRPHFLHAKHLRVDDALALIGSINLDIRSFALNAELGLLSYDPAVVAALREVEARTLADAERVEASTWKRRPGWRRAREGIARLADSLL